VLVVFEPQFHLCQVCNKLYVKATKFMHYYADNILVYKPSVHLMINVI